MYALIDNLIFPAPAPTYTAQTLKGKLIFVPKFIDHNQKLRLKKKE